jgi:hypothetical protein
VAATALPGTATAGQAAGGDMLTLWAEATGRRRAVGHGLGGLRFAFYGRVSTEDRQDPVTSRARQRDQAAALVAGHGRIVAEFFDTGYSRTLAWARRPQAAALLAALADLDRGWDAIVIGEYERAFYGGQYVSMGPLFEHYGHPAVDAGGRRADRLSRRRPRADNARAGAAVQARNRPYPDTGPHRDGDPDSRARTVPRSLLKS